MRFAGALPVHFVAATRDGSRHRHCSRVVIGAVRVASPLFKGEGRERDDLKPVAVGVNAHPSPPSSPLRKGRGD